MGLFFNEDINTLFVGGKEVSAVYMGSEQVYPVGLPEGTVFNFSYTGNVQSVELPRGKYKLQCWGAQGGTSYGSSNGAGSKGGYSEGILTLTEKKTLYVFVGGQGSRGSSTSLVNGGWNGGGASTGYSSYTSGNETGYSYPACGGGATDISTVTSSMSYSSGRTNRSSASLLARCIVAGGGAGGSYRYTTITTTNETTNIVNKSMSTSGTTYGSDGYTYGSIYGLNTVGAINDSFTLTNNSNVRIQFVLYSNSNSNLYQYTISSGGSETFTRPNNCSWVQVRSLTQGNYVGSLYVTLSYQVRETETNTSTSNSSGYSNKAQQGGGTSGKGQYPGTQTSAGSGGGFGYGGNQNTTNYMYCSGGGGGGWYGGGTGRADGSKGYVNYSGGGSGFVNTAANASSRPSGYTGLQLDSGTTIAGNTSHPSTSGGTETGHSGNGYARITILDPNYVPDPLEDYTLLSYIKSGSGQYINTKVIPTSEKLRVLIDFSYNKLSDASVFGMQQLNITSRFGLICYGSPAVIYVGASNGILPKSVSANTKYLLDVEANNGTITTIWNGESTSTSYSGTMNKEFSMYLFGNNMANNASELSSITVYSCKIYDNDVLVRDYIPVKRNSDNVCGLWDKVNEVFYTSSSGTNFTGA